MKRKICGYIAMTTDRRADDPKVVCTLPPGHREPHDEFKYMHVRDYARAMREGIDDETISSTVPSTRLHE